MNLGTCYPCSKYLLLIINLFFWVKQRIFSIFFFITIINMILVEWFSDDYLRNLFSSSTWSSTNHRSIQLDFFTFIRFWIRRFTFNSSWFYYFLSRSIWLLWCTTWISNMFNICKCWSKERKEDETNSIVFLVHGLRYLRSINRSWILYYHRSPL